jgi:peptidoglycan/LPS O-acetylase OafA/YrhL
MLMGQDQIVDAKRRYLPCLEGIRGYGFLLVFCGHYILANRLAHPGTIRLKLLTAVSSLGLFAVPAFFVLSGYLIGGILYHTRNREGYFKVFYVRRILRVFPVFYLTLLAIAGFSAVKHIPLDGHFWSHFLYIQNLELGMADRGVGRLAMTHFWSLAVEEQFYLIWPLVVWRFRDARQLIGISAATILLCCLIRFSAPLLGISVRDLSFFTLTRVDAVLLGVLLSLTIETDLVRSIKPYAKWAALLGIVSMATLGVLKGETWAMSTYTGKETWITLANFSGVAILMAVLEEGSVLNRICSQKWICMFGALSYSLYVFHAVYQQFFTVDVTNYLCRYMRISYATLFAAALALSVTFALSLLSMKFLEMPLVSLKKHIRYGNAQDVRVEPAPDVEPVLAQRGA